MVMVQCITSRFAAKTYSVLYLKVICSGEDSLFGFLQQRDWDILIMEAHVHVPSNDGPQQTLRIEISDFRPSLDYEPERAKKIKNAAYKCAKLCGAPG
ncbi:unnamed protein product [Eruca vesicaria subsp. sativa]|uniref:Uncharacterized protein n=1 Tax=Eruca vesicaria subsp. sativa TaxID=29727 RepID=A0ABC8LWV9_ERUVS|nr:unnamed protein product [Eruca vesicaria subsp. sativa]